MSQTAELFIDSRCRLGEGVFWNPLREQLFWFDILEKTLFAANVDGSLVNRWTFDRMASAAGIVDEDTLIVAAQGALLELDLITGEDRVIVEIEPDLPGNRTNDGRVGPAGGFWIGTMPHDEVLYSGSVYQYRDGALTKLFGDIRIPNSTCFSPDGRTAYFTDTPNRIIMQRPIDPDSGEPAGFWSVFAKTGDQPGAPDGSVVDAEGFLWNARWGGGRVIRYAPDGSVDREVLVPASQVTCPAFGGPDLKTLYITSASKNLSPEALAQEPHAGSVFAIELDVAGQRETLLRA
ncbi:MAG TPA: SMP-30/gluconolactonase/LRE family protein [Devosiaceae bacterium]|nr:SMP-30/gluconolactonase/LRE family protein [Devosiaceae bacterium]